MSFSLDRMARILTLYLSDNQISDLTPLEGFTQLKYLFLQDNPILDMAPLQTLLEKNPDLEVDIAKNFTRSPSLPPKNACGPTLLFVVGRFIARSQSRKSQKSHKSRFRQLPNFSTLPNFLTSQYPHLLILIRLNYGCQQRLTKFCGENGVDLGSPPCRLSDRLPMPSRVREAVPGRCRNGCVWRRVRRVPGRRGRLDGGGSAA